VKVHHFFIRETLADLLASIQRKFKHRMVSDVAQVARLRKMTIDFVSCYYFEIVFFFPGILCRRTYITIRVRRKCI
jgi:hypothetical protein